MLLNNQRLKNNQEHNNSYIYNNMTLFEHILIESRVDDFKKMLNRKFSIDYVQKIINRDTSKNHKNLLWIGKILMTEPDINDEDLFKNLEIFNKVGSSTDLYSFKDYITFLKFLEKKSKEVQMGKMAQIKAGTKTLKDDKRWQVVAPQTHDASKYFGGGTSWCISTSNDRYWKQYYYENTVVMIKDRNKKPNDLLFKVAIVGNANEQFWNTDQQDTKLDKIRELITHVYLWNTNDTRLSGDQRDSYLNQLPEDLIDDLMNYFNDDDISDRQHSYYYDLAIEKFDEGGKDELLKQLYKATIGYLDANDTDLDEDEFGDAMSRLFADEIEMGNWDEFLRELWTASVNADSPTDDNFYIDVDRRNFRNLISDTQYDVQTYLELAKSALTNTDISNMDTIIKSSLIKGVNDEDRTDPYITLKRQSNQLPDTNYSDILYKSLKMYNAKYNPNFLQGQKSLDPSLMGIVNKFTPRNIQDVIKVLSINPRAKDMVDWIQKYRKDLYESKKKSIKYRDFYKL